MSAHSSSRLHFAPWRLRALAAQACCLRGACCVVFFRATCGLGGPVSTGRNQCGGCRQPKAGTSSKGGGERGVPAPGPCWRPAKGESLLVEGLRRGAKAWKAGWGGPRLCVTLEAPCRETKMPWMMKPRNGELSWLLLPSTERRCRGCCVSTPPVGALRLRAPFLAAAAAAAAVAAAAAARFRAGDKHAEPRVRFPSAPLPTRESTLSLFLAAAK